MARVTHATEPSPMQGGVTRARPDPRAVELARETPWTLEAAEAVVEARDRLCPEITLRRFSEAMAQAGSALIEWLEREGHRENLAVLDDLDLTAVVGRDGEPR